MTIRSRWLRLAIAAVILAIGALFGSRIRIDNDISRLLPDSNADLLRAARALGHLTHRTIVDISIGSGLGAGIGAGIEDGPEAGPDAGIDAGAATRIDDPTVRHAILGRFADEFAARLLASGHVASVRSRMDADAALPIIEMLRERAPLLTKAIELADIELALEPERAIAEIRQLARRIQEPDGAHLKSRAATDPLGLTDRVLAPLAAFGDTFPGARLVDDLMTSADGRHVLVLVDVGSPPNDTERNQAFITATQQIVASLQADPANRGVRIRFFGAHRATLDNVQQIQRDVFWTSTIGASIVALLAILCFGRMWLALLALSPALFGAACAWGAFSLFADVVSGAVLGFGAVLLGLTIDFAIHVLFRLDRGGGPVASPGTSPGAPPDASTVALPTRALYMGGTTTSLAFLVLQASSLPALRDIGVLGAVGVFAAALFALYVLPAVGVARRESRPILDLQRIVVRLQRPAPIAIILALIASPVLLTGILRLRFDGDPTNLSSLTPAAAADEHAIQSVWGRADQLSTLIVEGADLETALANNDALATWLGARRTDGTIRGHSSISGLLPALATQRRRLAAWNELFDAERIAQLRTTLRQATESTLFRDGAFEPFLAWLSESPPLLTYDEQKRGPAGQLLADGIFEEDGVWRIMTPVATADWETTATLIDRLALEFPDVTLLNRQAFARQLASMVTGEGNLLAVLALLVVAAVVFVWLGRVLITLVVLLPLLLALGWTIGLLGWFGIPISLANAIFVVFLFGVAADYAIFLTTSRLDRFRTGVDRTTEAQSSVLLCTLTTCGGFGSLAAAGHPVLHAIGLTALIGILSAAVATQVFVPFLAGALLRRGGPNGTPGVPHVVAAFRVCAMMVVRGAWFLLTDRTAAGAGRMRAAMAAIHRMTQRIRKVGLGHREFVDEHKLLEEPCIFVANHESMFDIVGALSFRRPIQILVKRWVWRSPAMGRMVRTAGYVLAREDNADEVFAAVSQRVQDGHSVLVFPEGTRSRTGRIGRFHNGAFAMARRLGVKVQPLAMVNTREVVPPGTWWIGDHDARVCVLDPMDPAAYSGDDGDRRMARAARDRVRERCAELWPATQRGPHWWKIVGGMYRYLGPVVSHYAVSKCKRDPLIRELPDLCPGTGSILVAGCGLGLTVARLALAYPEREITAIDLDERKVTTLRAALGDRYPVALVIGDLTSCDLPQVATALLVDVLHYSPAPTQERILRRIVDSLPPGGSLLFRDGCARSEIGHGINTALESFAVRSGFTRGGRTLHYRTEDGWRTLLRQCGLEVETARPALGRLSDVVFVSRKDPTGSSTLPTC